ncbi:MAG TPA: ribonuclease HI, partial [Rubricoccaceae bacterium]|nr:ribonuclease HI [Rubricoccaceae bacterium]
MYTDGSCSGNPGPGGWAALLRYGTPPHLVEREVTGHAAQTTNNRMELTAVVEALAALKEPCHALVHSDSAYVVNAFREGWLDGWIRRGWKTADKKPVLNRDLWERL